MTKIKAKTSTKNEAKRTKTKAKAYRRITKASTSKTSATKTSAPMADDDIGLLVLGFDEQQKPCGARFVGAKPDLVAKAAQLMGLEVYKATSPLVAEVAKKLPVGQLYATGRAFVPHVRQSLTARSLSRSRPNRGRPQSARTTTRPARRSPAACPAAGTRSRRATSSSRKKASPTGGGRRSCSTAKTTC